MNVTSEILRRYVKIGIALSAEKNISRLLEMIVSEARYLSSADAGTLYLVDKEKKALRFAIMQNTAMEKEADTEKKPMVPLKDVPLYDSDGNENHANVSTHVALTGKPVNIPDVYKAGEFDFTGPRAYDAATGYRSTSMLVIPLKNHESSIIGVIQLLNAIDTDTGEIIPFNAERGVMVASLSSLAAVALTNAQLITDLKNLFNAFIKSIATAIEQKSPFTGGHIKRVVDLTMAIAAGINEKASGPFRDVSFTNDEIEELRISAWMHDVGKIAVPEHIVNKETKLHVLCDQFNVIETRYALIRQLTETAFLNKKIRMLTSGEASDPAIDQLDRDLNEQLKELDQECQFLKTCNQPGEFLDDAAISRIREISKKTYEVDGQPMPFLTPFEVENICIRRGTLNATERKTIENHALMTLNILEALPFPKNLRHVPDYAGGHHERPDGTGYPRGLSGDDLSLQARIMAIADIFESLTAKDRPYREPIRLSEAIRIMEQMKKDNQIDPDIFELFKTDHIFRRYAEKELHPGQIDL